MLKTLIRSAVAAVLLSGVTLGTAAAEDKPTFRIAWSIYAGWMPWDYMETSGIMDKWADRYDINVEIVQVNDYIESINQYTAGQFDGVTATSMDSLSIPAAGGVDSTAVIVGDYSNGNDGIVLKGSDKLEAIEGRDVHLVKLSVSHYLLARALDRIGLSEKDVNVISISDADLVSAFKTEDVRAVATWNPLLSDVRSQPDAHEVFDSSQIPGHIKDLLIVKTKTLNKHPELGKALTGAWYEMVSKMMGDDKQGREIRKKLGEASGTDRAGYEMQLAGMKFFEQPQTAVDFISSDQAFEAMDSVRKFSFRKGLLGEAAPSADFVGIKFPDGRVLGRESNINLRFTTKYMQMAADDEL
jgi:NitT/TauT family transport system substrate-binding protein